MAQSQTTKNGIVSAGLGLTGLMILALGCGSVRTPSEEILVSPQWIDSQGESLVILDFGRSEEDFLAGHIPGAVYVPRAVVWDQVDGIPGMLPDPEQVAAELGEFGVDNAKAVVVYDSGNGLWASRAFWALEYLGHSQAHVLDGGYAAYQSSGLAVSTTPSIPVAGVFTANVQEDLLASQDFIVSNLKNEAVKVLDTRSLGEYQGTDLRAERGGHIPGSLHIEWRENLNADNSFKSLADLEAVYGQKVQGTDTAVTLCQTGVRGSHSYLALRLLGYEKVKLYDGSWAQWGNDNESPIDS
jgi:thiosulfate/3-mercaptopyruvate sulfurtransferase